MSNEAEKVIENFLNDLKNIPSEINEPMLLAFFSISAAMLKLGYLPDQLGACIQAISMPEEELHISPFAPFNENSVKAQQQLLETFKEALNFHAVKKEFFDLDTWEEGFNSGIIQATKIADALYLELSLNDDKNLLASN